MASGDKKSRTKVAIIILSVLLALSLIGIAAVLIYNRLAPGGQGSVVVPDNIISNTGAATAAPTPECGTTAPPECGTTAPPESGTTAAPGPEDTASEGSGNTSSAPTTAGASSAPADITATPSAEITAPALMLSDRNPDDNIRMYAANMFPGDSETQYYCIRVSYKDDVILRFRADVLPGSEKLAEVLKCKVVLPESGELLYDGLMKDMPQSLNHSLETQQATVSEVYYAITVYLETSVGNDYMDRELTADYNWWVEETGNLNPPPTGDDPYITVWLCAAAVAFLLLILLLRRRSKGERTNEQ